jgi:hypothetical protein
VFIHREDAELFIEEVRGDEPVAVECRAWSASWGVCEHPPL